MKLPDNIQSSRPWLTGASRGPTSGRYSRALGALLLTLAFGATWLGGSSLSRAGMPIEINERIPINFGIINKPTIGSNTFSLHWNTNVITTTGAGNGWYVGGATSGYYQAKAQPNMAVHVMGDILNFSTGGVQITKVFVNGANSSGLLIGRQGSRGFVELGGEVMVTSSSVQGIHDTTVLLSLNYE